MAISVQILSVDAATREQRTITLVKTGTSTLSAYYATSANPGDVKQVDLSDVGANVDTGKISVTYGSFPFGVTATGTLAKNPPSVSADVGPLGRYQFPLQPGDYDKIIGFLQQAKFPSVL